MHQRGAVGQSKAAHKPERTTTPDEGESSPDLDKHFSQQIISLCVQHRWMIRQQHPVESEEVAFNCTSQPLSN